MKAGHTPVRPPPQRRSRRAADVPVAAAVAVAAARPQVVRPLERLVPAVAPGALPVRSPAQVERAARRMQPAVVRPPERLRAGRAELPRRVGDAAAVAVAGGAVRRQFPLPLAGNTFARGGGWTSPYVPMGMGLVDIFRYATVLRDIGFDGPMELEAEYPNGGAQSAADKLTLPREQVIGNMKRDVLTIRAAFQQSGAG